MLDSLLIPVSKSLKNISLQYRMRFLLLKEVRQGLVSTRDRSDIRELLLESWSCVPGHLRLTGRGGMKHARSHLCSPSW